MAYKIVGADENNLFPPRIESRLFNTFVKKDSNVVNVKDHGVKGDGVTDDSAAFADIFADGNIVALIPEGVYNLIAGGIPLRENTIVIMTANTIIKNSRTNGEFVFHNGEEGNMAFAVGYDGPGNIHIIGNGATIDNGPRASQQLLTKAVTFMHARNVSVEGLTVVNNYSSHCMELNAVRDGIIRGCYFVDAKSGGLSNRSAINIDSATQAGQPSWGSWDNTPCENILIDGNTFRNVPNGVDNHNDTAVNRCRDIRIVNNTFEQINTDHGIRTTLWENVVISNNTFENVAHFAIWADSVNDIIISNNIIIDACQLVDSTAIRVGGTFQPTNVIISGNEISNKSDSLHYLNGISFAAGSKIVSTGNIVDRGPNGDIYIASFVDAIVDGSWRATIPDDGVSRFTVPGNKQGIVLINTHSGAASAMRGMWWVRAGVGQYAIAEITRVPGAGVDTVNGVNLTGAIGTDGNMTVSVFNDDLVIENRTGSVKIIDVTFAVT